MPASVTGVAPLPLREGGDCEGADVPSVIFVSAARSFDSESSRKLAPTTTLSPAFTPERICALPSPRTPTFTSRGSKLPPPASTNAITRRPVSISAESGMTTPVTLCRSSETLAYICGFRRRPGLGKSKRTLSVRVSGEIVG